jgi:hypothetical protein
MPATTDAEALLVRWQAQDYASGVSSYTVQYRRGLGTWRTWLAGTKKTSGWFAGDAGSTYEFRVRAIDFKGNAQRWVTVPGRPVSVRPGAFARVSAATLNIRSGPGTQYGIVDGAVAGDVVYVLEGPVAAGGYQWFRVQYGFSEWPSAEFPRIAWMAGSQSGTSMLAPRRAPTVTRLSPFVDQTGRTDRFSPNGDGVLDGARVDFTLKAAATAVQLDVLNAAGAVVQSVAVGARSGGANSATWNGRVNGGAWAPAGSYLLRVLATDAAGTQHAGPASGFSQAALGRWGVVADLVAPAVAGSPRRGAEMVPAKTGAQLIFSEPISGLSSATLQLQVNGAPVAADVQAAPNGRSATVTPQAPLPVNATVRFWLSDQLHDQAGNPLSTTGWGFRTAPGTVYRPGRAGVMASGAQLGYGIAQDGDLRRLDRAMLARARSFRAGQRATVPNLPGRWLQVEAGPLAGTWVRESQTAFLRGFVEVTSYPSGVPLRLRSAVHVGRRFSADGSVRAGRTMTAATTTTITADARAIINGRPSWHVATGPLHGYWLAESAVAFKPGSIERMELPSGPSIDLSPGTHTGYRYNAHGAVTGSQTVHYRSARSVTVTAWKIVNGRAHYLVSAGVLGGTWLPESSATHLHV